MNLKIIWSSAVILIFVVAQNNFELGWSSILQFFLDQTGRVFQTKLQTRLGGYFTQNFGPDWLSILNKTSDQVGLVFYTNFGSGWVSILHKTSGQAWVGIYTNFGPCWVSILHKIWTRVDEHTTHICLTRLGEYFTYNFGPS